VPAGSGRERTRRASSPRQYRAYQGALIIAETADTTGSLSARLFAGQRIPSSSDLADPISARVFCK